MPLLSLTRGRCKGKNIKNGKNEKKLKNGKKRIPIAIGSEKMKKRENGARCFTEFFTMYTMLPSTSSGSDDTWVQLGKTIR